MLFEIREYEGVINITENEAKDEIITELINKDLNSLKYVAKAILQTSDTKLNSTKNLELELQLLIEYLSNRKLKEFEKVILCLSLITLYSDNQINDLMKEHPEFV